MTTPTTTIRLPGELRERLRQYAKAENLTNTDVIIRALQTFLEQESSASREQRVRKELARLDDIDRSDPELEAYYRWPETDSLREPS